MRPAVTRRRRRELPGQTTSHLQQNAAQHWAPLDPFVKVGLTVQIKLLDVAGRPVEVRVRLETVDAYRAADDSDTSAGEHVEH